MENLESLREFAERLSLFVLEESRSYLDSLNNGDRESAQVRVIYQSEMGEEVADLIRHNLRERSLREIVLSRNDPESVVQSYFPGKNNFCIEIDKYLRLFEDKRGTEGKFALFIGERKTVDQFLEEKIYEDLEKIAGKTAEDIKRRNFKGIILKGVDPYFKFFREKMISYGIRVENFKDGSEGVKVYGNGEGWYGFDTDNTVSYFRFVCRNRALKIGQAEGKLS